MNANPILIPHTAMAWEVVPTANKMLHLVPFPDNQYRYTVMALVFACIGGTFLWDRLITMVFAPKVFKAMLDEGKKTSFKDVLPIFTTLGKVFVGFAIFATGNPIIYGACFMGYRYYNQVQEKKMLAKEGLLEE